VQATDNYPSSSVRQGDWKFIRIYGEGPDRSCSYELFNLKDDIGEEHNLAQNYPELVKKFDALIEEHLKETGGIIPVLNPVYNTEAQNPMGIKPVFPIENYPSY
jgi:arylsulfatase A-like enzyme